MKLKKKYQERAAIGEYVGETHYASGLLRLSQYLFVDLSDLLEAEGRRFGIVISYLDSVYNTCKRIDITPDEETNEKIIYLYKPIVISEFKKLCRKHVSRADSVIVILKKILEAIDSIENTEYPKETKTLLKIVTKLYDNIRNKAKLYPLPQLTLALEEFIGQGVVGKYGVDKFSILEEEEKRIRKPLVGSGVRVKKEQSKVLEVTWKEE